MNLTQKFWIFIISILVSNSLFAQRNKEKKEDGKKDPYKSTEIWEPIPINRQGFHAYVDKQQKAADVIDGFTDGVVNIDDNSRKSKQLTEALLKLPDQYQIIIENLPLEHWDKIRYLKELETDLKQFNNERNFTKIDGQYYLDLMTSYLDILKVEMKKEDILDYVKKNFNLGVYGNLHMYEDNKPAVEEVYRRMVREYPDKMLLRLREFSGTDAADELITATAKKFPDVIMTYARSTSLEREVVRRNQDPLVKTIVKVSDECYKPLKALPFIDAIHKGVLSIDTMNKIIANDELYYKQLVRSKMDQPTLGLDVINREMKVEALKYVRVMNELHDEPALKRFKCIEPVTAPELYYMLVLCSDEIYTSSFTGSFDRLMDKMKPQKGNRFLDSLHFDKFRTFIRMSAGYNKLKEFLGTMNEEEKKELMASFVNNIDRNSETDLEDAVDVADALASLNDSTTLVFLRGEIQKNYERTYKSNNKRGLVIYFLLHTLSGAILNPNDTTDDLQEILKVPPITRVPFESLANDSGIVYEQHFFYGDKDGEMSYNSFLANFPSTKWTKKDFPKWITLTSKEGKKPIVIFANKPLPEPEDEQAQEDLYEYMTKENIHPSIIVHRGHSYHLPGTLKYLDENDKIVILGSCGGYHNLSTILNSSEDAHIVSSKQTGTMHVNDPLIANLNNKLAGGKDINWIQIWNELAAGFEKSPHKDQFDDYVPPHKNMGALFLKAFKIQMSGLE